MRTKALAATLGLLTTLTLTACDDDVPTDATDSGTDAEAYPGESVVWADKDHAQRQAFMTLVVLPTMKEKFVGQDADTWPDVTCNTCHGEDPQGSNYKMPSVFALDPDQFPQPGHSANVDYMYETVLPTMLGLLDAEPLDEGTGEGFGCYSCHMMP